jgi:hypothetical protein
VPRSWSSEVPANLREAQGKQTWPHPPCLASCLLDGTVLVRCCCTNTAFASGHPFAQPRTCCLGDLYLQIEVPIELWQPTHLSVTGPLPQQFSVKHCIVTYISNLTCPSLLEYSHPPVSDRPLPITEPCAYIYHLLRHQYVCPPTHLSATAPFPPQPIWTPTCQ